MYFKVHFTSNKDFEQICFKRSSSTVRSLINANTSIQGAVIARTAVPPPREVLYPPAALAIRVAASRGPFAVYRRRKLRGSEA